MRQNVVMIVLDAARADAFEPYGARTGSTPVIADLARRGQAVPDAHSAACWTVPSHGALFTGMLPRENGLTRAPGGLPHGCRPILESHRERLLAQVLRLNGYSTAGISTNLWLTGESGFATGFDHFVNFDTERRAALSHGNRAAHAHWLAEGSRSRVDDGARVAGSEMRRWIERGPVRPFFWFVNLVEAHSPYLPPRPYNDLALADRIRAAEDARRYHTLGAIWQACAGGLEVPQDVLGRMRHLYRRAVLSLDDWVGDLVESLDSAGLLDDTILIVTSDHGENLGEQGMMGHAFSLDDRLMRVPLVIAGGDLGAPVKGPFSLASLPALIADAVGLDEHPWTLPEAGEPAVAHFDPPTSSDDPRVAEALEAWGLGPEAAPRITTKLTAATTGQIKLVRRGERDDFYDLSKDPLEENPVPAMQLEPSVVDTLRGAIDRLPTDATQVDAGKTTQPSADELKELEDRMRLLGYM